MTSKTASFVSESDVGMPDIQNFHHKTCLPPRPHSIQGNCPGNEAVPVLFICCSLPYTAAFPSVSGHHGDGSCLQLLGAHSCCSCNDNISCPQMVLSQDLQGNQETRGNRYDSLLVPLPCLPHLQYLAGYSMQIWRGEAWEILVSSPDAKFFVCALRPCRVWTLSPIKLGCNHTSVSACCCTHQIARVK